MGVKRGKFDMPAVHSRVCVSVLVWFLVFGFVFSLGFFFMDFGEFGFGFWAWAEAGGGKKSGVIKA